MRVRCTTLVLRLWLGVRLYIRQGGVGPSCFGVWEGPKGRILRVMGYVFFRPQGKGRGATVYDSFDLKAISKRVV